MIIDYKKVFLVIALSFTLFGVEVRAMREDNDKKLSEKLHNLLSIDLYYKPRHSLDEYVSIMDQMKNINIPNSKGNTVLHIAARDNRADVVKALINRGANPNIKGFNGATPLMLAVEKGDVETIKELIRAKADLNMQSDSNATALLLAVIAGHPEAVKELILASADIYISHISKDTPLILAASVPLHINPTEEITQIQASMARMILEKATQLTKDEKESIKNWLLVNQRLGAEGRPFLPKDPKMIVAKKIYETFPGLLRERVIRAGGLEALNRARRNLPAIAQLIEQYLDPQFLEQRVRSQLPRMP